MRTLECSLFLVTILRTIEFLYKVLLLTDEL